MRLMLIGMAVAGVGGAAFSGSLSGHDVERVIAKPPAVVYAAVSAMAPSGEQHSEDPTEKDQYSLKVDKVAGRSIHYEISRNGRTLGEIELGFEADGEAGTRMTADLEIDKAHVEELGEDAAEFASIPDAVINFGFARAVNEMADQIEAGKPLGSWQSYESRMRQMGSASLPERRRMAREQQAEAAAPMASAKPMVDPNEAAREYLKPTR